MTMEQGKDLVTLTSSYLPEGYISHTQENQRRLLSLATLRQSVDEGDIVEGTALLCDSEHNLTVSLGRWTATIPRIEAAIGIEDGSTRDIAILSRVGKPVACVITAIELRNDQPHLILSRRRAQLRAREALLNLLRPGHVIPAVITHLEPFGAFVDIGCGVTSMIGIEHISVSRIPHTAHRFTVGQKIHAVVLDIDKERKRIYLTHRELLGTWEENASQFQVGMTVPGIVRGAKDYGLFVELSPNLSGLAELNPKLNEGDRASVYIKAIIPQRMKIKLLAIDRLPPEPKPAPLHYFITSGSIEKWKYAPDCCAKVSAETVFAP